MSRVPTTSFLGVAIVATLSLLAVLIVPAWAGITVIEYGGDRFVEFGYDSFADLPCSPSEEVHTVTTDNGLGTTFTAAEIDMVVTVTQNQKQQLDRVEVTIGASEVPGHATLPAGSHQFERRCDELTAASDRTFGEQMTFTHSRVLLEKTVEGDVPTGTQFTIQVDCDVSGDPFLSTTRTFDADGGLDQVVFYEFQQDVTCVFEETAPTGTGAPDDVTYTPADTTPDTDRGAVQFDSYLDRDADVLNTYPTTPEPSPSPEPSPTPTPEVADTVEEAEPAEAVDAEADFTG